MAKKKQDGEANEPAQEPATPPADAAEATAESAAPAPPVAEAPLPAAIKLVRPHGFIDEAGVHRYWQTGQVVFDPADIKLLVGRGAEFAPAEPPAGQ